MNKPKVPPQNPLVYWWNEFLFARSFVYTSSLSPEDTQAALYEIAHPVEGGWFSFNTVSKTVDIQPEHFDASSLARFDIRLKRRNRGFDYTMAKAEGSISFDETGGATIIQGRTKFGALQYLLVVVYVLIFGMVFLNLGSFITGFPVWMVLILMLVLGYTWYRMYSDRNYLTSLIGTTLREAELADAGKSKQKRGDSDILENLVDLDESTAHRWKRR